MPRGYAYEWTGVTREEIKTGIQTTFIFLLSVVFVFFLLAAQYESYILPLAVILTVPTGIFGVFAFIGFAGIENNIYVQIGLIMLIGLLAKNAILIVEYAVQRRKAGMTLIAVCTGSIPIKASSYIDDLLCIYCGIASAYLGNRWICTG